MTWTVWLAIAILLRLRGSVAARKRQLREVPVA